MFEVSTASFNTSLRSLWEVFNSLVAAVWIRILTANDTLHTIDGTAENTLKERIISDNLQTK